MTPWFGILFAYVSIGLYMGIETFFNMRHVIECPDPTTEADVVAQFRDPAVARDTLLLMRKHAVWFAIGAAAYDFVAWPLSVKDRLLGEKKK